MSPICCNLSVESDNSKNETNISADGKTVRGVEYVKINDVKVGSKTWMLR